MTVKNFTFKICIILICLVVDAYGDCDYQACLKKLGTNDMKTATCDALKTAIDCALQTLKNNSDCSSVKSEIDEKVNAARTIMKEKSCPDNASSLTTPLVLCVALSCVTFWMMTFV